MLHKYMALLRRHITSILEYRASVMIWMLTSVTPLAMLAVWSSMAEEGPIAGYSQADFASYFLLLAVARQMTNAWIAWELDGDIRSGGLAVRLLHPLDPMHDYIAENLADKVVRLILLTPLVILAFLVFPVVRYDLNPLTGAMFIAALLVAWWIQFVAQYIFGLLSFWVSSSQTLHEIWFAFAMFLGGMLAPLDLFPPTIGVIARYLPFRYMLSFPVEILVGKSSLSEVLYGFGVGVFWLITLVALGRFLWQRGLRQFGAFGA